MWLKIIYDQDDILKWPNQNNKIFVQLSYQETAPIENENKSFRISPIFPLVSNTEPIEIVNQSLHFFSFSETYRILGRASLLGSEKLKNSIYFSHGLASIIIISSSIDIVEEFRKIASRPELAYEIWILKNSHISKIEYNINSNGKEDLNHYKLKDYLSLPVTDRVLIDEFHGSFRLLLIKMVRHMPTESDKMLKLVTQINRYIETLVYLNNFKGKVPDYLSDHNAETLKDARISGIIKNQIIDRIIQINSALSYVSTQAFSGAIPILERRSLIRRYSLLGIGSAILALNNIARFIENCFSTIPMVSIIEKTMPIAGAIQTLQLPNYYDKVQDWHLSSVDKIQQHNQKENTLFKLPYFNGRLGFRETEFSIAAAIQSVSSGASLEWSLMTLTHEMLHGHVRKILNTMFFGEDNAAIPKLKTLFYQNFKKTKSQSFTEEKLIDSLRAIIFTYCCLAYDFGSLTNQKPTKAGTVTFHLLSQERLFEVFETEYRNINEIFVHVLDLHYFYASRISVYIPLIWGSWVAVPYTSADLRQYILRSLLAISSKVSGKVPSRFNESVGTLRRLLSSHLDGKLKHPVIHDVIAILNDEKLLDTYYYPAFKTSIIIVDLAKNIFYSKKIRASVFADDLIEWDNEGSEQDFMESVFSYNLDPGFNDEYIESPIAYLLDRMIRILNSNADDFELERETTLQYIALNCKKTI